MRDLASWLIVLALSGAMHLVMAVLMIWLLEPRDVQQKPSGEAEVRLATLSVPRSTASTTTPEAEGLQTSIPGSKKIQGGLAPTSTANPIAPAGAASPSLSPPSISAVVQPISGGQSVAAKSEDSPLFATAASLEMAHLSAGANPLPIKREAAQASRVQGTKAPSRIPPQEDFFLTRAGQLAERASSPSIALSPAYEARYQPDITPRISPSRHQAPAATVDAPSAMDLATVPATSQVAEFGSPPAQQISVSVPQVDRPSSLSVRGARSEPKVEAAVSLGSSRPSIADAVSAASNGQSVNPIAPAPNRAPAVLAWSGDLSLQIGQQTLDAAAALGVAPPDTGEAGLRDALSDRLASVECARAQTVYDPSSGAIDLRGHVRTDADRDTLLAAVSDELGGALPVVDRLRRLDAPQCEVLVRLAEIPMPQSVEQLINPLIIGDDLHTRVYRFGDNQPVRFDLAGADYDGWIYLDYFDNEGRVLHLIPNDYIEPFILPANVEIVFGGGSENDLARGKFELRVSPPFGQDIAVAMVSNRKLFDLDRPTIELAEDYLVDLAARVEDLQKQDSRFKGEWVYLFIETHSQR